MVSNLKSDFLEKFLKVIEIQRMIVDDSKYLDVTQKKGIVNFGDECLEMVTKEHLTLTQLRSTSKMLLTFWNESIGVDTELFWTEFKEHKLDFERNDELKFALNKNTFRRVDQGFGARRDWNLMKDMQSLKDRFSESEIEQIGKIIEADENNRVDILKKCLIKKKIPQSKYLKFGECWAYLSYCNLFDKHFIKAEIDELDNIWTNFK